MIPILPPVGFPNNSKVHVLNEPRGSTLEVVISRMRTRTSNIRFILVSATVPNIRDIADWIGNPTINCDAPASVFEVGILILSPY